MDPKKAYQDIQTLHKQRLVLSCVLVCLLVTNLFLAGIVFSQKPKTILVPPFLNKTVSLEGESFSKAYIEEMTSFFIYLLLELSKDTLSYKSQRLLRHVDSDSYESLKTYFKEEEKKLKDYNLKTSFSVTGLTVHSDNLGADVTGVLKSDFMSEGIKESQASYRIRYKGDYGRLLLKNFDLIKDDVK